MKSKIFLYLSLFAGLAFTACNDDDITVNTTPILDAQSVVTGSADVTATTATLHGTVAGLENSSPSSYVVGFNYGMEEGVLNQNINGSLSDGVITAELTGLPDGTTVYYQAFAKLQGKVSSTGEVKSLVTTDAVVATKDAAAISDIAATLGASVTGAPDGAKFGIVIAPASVEEEEGVRAGLIVPADADGADFVVSMKGLAPAAAYKYAGYADLGSGVIYGPVKTFTTSASTFDVENDLVDLGLSVKWAKYNIGAHSEGEFGGYFGFGDVHGVMNTTITKNYAEADVYRTASDVAYNAYGGRATLPSADDFKELFTKCSKEWVTVDGVNGYRFTGPNGNSIFLPAAGSRTVNDIAGQGIDGMYATGSLVGAGSKYAVAYNFSSSTVGKVNAPVYQALSARAVSTARNVPFDKSLLYNTWEIDFNEGKSIRFAGPVHFYGVDDCWRTVTNNEPLIGDVWAWEAGTGDEWAFKDCSGYMTLTEDGKVIVKMQDGAEVEGTYTVDEDNKTITSTVDLLHPSAMENYANYKTEIKILSLDADRFQLGFFRDFEPATVSVNMVPQGKKYGLPVYLNLAAGDWSGVWDAELASIIPDELEGKHTLVYEGSATEAMVFTLDIKDLVAKYPNAIATVTDIRLDGESIPFDASKCYYGDLENNGKFRIQLFNAYGYGNVANAVPESPFSDGVNLDAEPAIKFSEKIEFDLSIVLDNTFTPGFILVNDGWSSSLWGVNSGDSFKVQLNGGKYELSADKFNISVSDAGFAGGPILCYIDTPKLSLLFPGAKYQLDEIALDGTVKTGWDGSKIINTSAEGKGVDHRFELFNCWGATKENSAFGPNNGDLCPGLAFSSSIAVKCSVLGLY